MKELMIEQILTHIMRSVHTMVRIFDKNGELLQYYGNEKEADPLLEDKELLGDMLSQVKEGYPLIYQDFYPIYFIAMEHSELIYIIGAVNCDYTIEKINESPIGAFFSNKHGLKEVKCRISFCEFVHFCEECLLLYNILNNRKMTYWQLIDKNSHVKGIEKAVKEELNQVYFHYQENEKLHNPYDQEIRELDSIREGNVENLLKSMEEEFEGEYAVLSKEPLRAAKNISIVSLALTARAAIDGGLLPEESFSINDSYILQIDTASSMLQVHAIARQAKIEYAKLVKERRISKQKNRIVEDAKRLIYKKMHDKIVIQNIAEELLVTPQYLSVLFKRIEGVSINEYIMQKKIGLAENLLTYSKYSIGDIGFYLGFCSQSHFGRQFKKVKGMTPRKYREKYGAKEFIDKF